MRRTPWTNRRILYAERGQALAEFLAVAFALIPLFLLVPMIAKYQDISHATRMASRYVAFEAITRNDSQSSWKPKDQLADEVLRRFFSNSDAPVKTNDVAGDFKAHQNPFWSDIKGDALIKNFSDVSVTFGASDGISHADAFSGASDGEPFNQEPVLANASKIGLQARGIYTANVVVNIANLPEGIDSIKPFDKIDLSIKRHTSLVIDPWMARSPEQTEDRFDNLVPLNQLLTSGIDTLIDVAITAFELGEVQPPEFGKLDKWRDAVPQDRLHPAQ